MGEGLIMLPGDIVKKSNLLCRARWGIESVFEPRLVALVASRVQIDDEDFHVYEIPAKELTGPTNDGGEAYRTIEAVADALMSRVITIREEGSRSFAKYNVFGRCVYDDKTKMISARFDPDLKPHYLGLKEKFTEYSLAEFLTLPSIYSQRIFEILKSWNNLPVVTIPLIELHDMLAVPKTLRTDFFNFRRRVLDKAHKDIHAKTTLRYEWEPIKTGKAVTAIKFTFPPQSKQAQPPNVDNGPNATAALEAELRSLGANAKTAMDYATEAAQKGKAAVILSRLPGIIERADERPKSTRLRYIQGAVKKELKQQEIFDLPNSDPVDLEAEARKCWEEKRRSATICVPRQTGEPDGRKRCKICLEKIPG